jgi:rhodanese-related sulfurtransferase
MKKSLLSIIFLGLMFGNASADVDVSQLAKKKHTPQGKYLTAKDTYELLQKDADNVLFIDVRTRSEVAFVGMTHMVDANIPYMVSDIDGWNEKKNQFDMMPNSNFGVAFTDALEAKGLNKDSKIIVMCRSGSRSAKAANLLDQMGYKNVYTVVDGFEGDKAKSGPNKGHRVINGWKNSGLPWSYKLAKGKMYFE